MIAAGIIAVIVLSVMTAQPIYVLLGGLAGFLLLFATAGDQYATFADLNVLIELTQKLGESEVLLAIPFFVISGAIMSEGDIARRLVRFASNAFRGIPGGLAVGAVIGCIFFAAISGSSPVTVIAIGSIVYPALLKEGYGERFSSGLLSSAGSLGILIPPSIPMIIYTVVDPMALADPANVTLAAEGGNNTVKELFLAGALPGLFIGSLFVVYSIIAGTRAEQQSVGATSPLQSLMVIVGSIGRFFGRILVLAVIIPTFLWVVILVAGRSMSNPPEFLAEGSYLRDTAESFWDSFWAMMLPVVILGGIYSGLFTATEAACISVVYAMFVEIFIYRSLNLKRIPAVFGEATILIGSLLIIIAVAQGLNKYIETAQIPEYFVDLILEMQLTTVGFLLVINILLLVVGFFMDIMSAILILVPLLSPIAYQLGIHPIHLAVIFIVNLEIGYLTPPLGLNLFVASTIFKQPIGETIRSVLPFIALMLCGLMAITYVPTISLGPVAAVNGHSFYVPFPERRIAMDTMETGEQIEFLARIGQLQAEQAEDGPGDSNANQGNSGGNGGGIDLSAALGSLTDNAADQIADDNARANSFEDLNDLVFVFDLLRRDQVELIQIDEEFRIDDYR